MHHIRNIRTTADRVTLAYNLSAPALLDRVEVLLAAVMDARRFLGGGEP